MKCNIYSDNLLLLSFMCLPNCVLKVIKYEMMIT